MFLDVDDVVKSYIDTYGSLPSAASFGYFISIDKRIVSYLRKRWKINCSEEMETLGKVPEKHLDESDEDGFSVNDLPGVVQFEKVSRVFFGLIQTRDTLSNPPGDPKNQGALMIVSKLISTVGGALASLRGTIRREVAFLDRESKKKVHDSKFWKTYNRTPKDGGDAVTIEARVQRVAEAAEQSAVEALKFRKERRGLEMAKDVFNPVDFVKDDLHTDVSTKQMNDLYTRSQDDNVTVNQKVENYLRYKQIRDERDGRQEQSRGYFLVGMQSMHQETREYLISMNEQRTDTESELKNAISNRDTARLVWEEAGGMASVKKLKQECAALRDKVGVAETAEERRMQDEELDKKLKNLDDLFKDLESLEEKRVITEQLSRRLAEIEMNRAFAKQKLGKLGYQISKITSATRKKESVGASSKRRKKRDQKNANDNEEAASMVDDFTKKQNAEALQELRDQLPPGASDAPQLMRRALDKIRRKRLVESAQQRLATYKQEVYTFESLKDAAKQERDEKFEELFKDMTETVKNLRQVRNEASSGVLIGIEGVPCNPASGVNYEEAANQVKKQNTAMTAELHKLNETPDERYHSMVPGYEWYGDAKRKLDEDSATFKRNQSFLTLSKMAIKLKAKLAALKTKAAIESEGDDEEEEEEPEPRAKRGVKRVRPEGSPGLEIKLAEDIESAKASLNGVESAMERLNATTAITTEERQRWNGEYRARQQKLLDTEASLLLQKRDRISVIEGRYAQNIIRIAAYSVAAQQSVAACAETTAEAVESREQTRQAAQVMIDEARIQYQDRLEIIGYTHNKKKDILDKTAWKPSSRAPATLIQANPSAFPHIAAGLKADSTQRNSRADLYKKVQGLYAAQCDLDYASDVEEFYSEVCGIAASAKGRTGRLPEQLKAEGKRFAWSEMKGTNGWVERLRATDLADRTEARKERNLVADQARETANRPFQDRKTLHMQMLVHEIGLFASKGSTRALAYCRLIINALQGVNATVDGGAESACVDLESKVELGQLAENHLPTYVYLQNLLGKWKKMPTQLRGCEMPPPEFLKRLQSDSPTMRMIQRDADDSELRVDNVTGELVATSTEDKRRKDTQRNEYSHGIAIPDETPIAFVWFNGQVSPVTDDLRLPRLSTPDVRPERRFVFHKTRDELERDYRRGLPRAENESATAFTARFKATLTSTMRWGGRDPITRRSLLSDPSSNEHLLSPAVQLGLERQRANIVAMRASLVILETEYKRTSLTFDEVFREGGIETTPVLMETVPVAVPTHSVSGAVVPEELLAVHRTRQALSSKIEDVKEDIGLAGKDWVGIDAQRVDSDDTIVQQISTQGDADGFVFCEKGDQRTQCGSGQHVYDEVSGVNWDSATRKKALDRAKLFLSKWYPWVPANHLPFDADDAEWEKFAEFAKWNGALKYHGCVSMVLCDQFNGLMNASRPPLRLGSGPDREIAPVGFMLERMKNHLVYFVDLRGEDALATVMPITTTYENDFSDLQPTRSFATFTLPYTARREADELYDDAQNYVPLQTTLGQPTQRMNDQMLAANMKTDPTFSADAFQIAATLAAQYEAEQREELARLRDAGSAQLQRLSTRVFRKDLVELPSKEEEEREMRALVRARMSRIIDGLQFRQEDTEAYFELLDNEPDRTPFRETPVAVTVAIRNAGGYTPKTFELGDPIYDSDILAQVCNKLREMEHYRNIRLGIATVVVDGNEAHAVVELEGGKSSIMNGKVVEPLFNWIGGGTEMHRFRKLCINAWKAAQDGQTAKIPEWYEAKVTRELAGASGAVGGAVNARYTAPRIDARSVSFAVLAAALAAHDTGPIKEPLRADGTALKPLLLEKLN